MSKLKLEIRCKAMHIFTSINNLQEGSAAYIRSAHFWYTFRVPKNYLLSVFLMDTLLDELGMLYEQGEPGLHKHSYFLLKIV